MMQKVSFNNQYQMKVAGNLYLPADMAEGEKRGAIIIGHPMGAVKEQSSVIYAEQLAARGFITLAIDLSFWGASEGKPRQAVLPDMYAEAFSAAVDFLGTRDFVEREAIAALGICGSGGFAISAAKIDPRLKAVATVSMYDMGAFSRHLYGNSLTMEQRQQMIAESAAQRYIEFNGGETRYTGGTPNEIDEDSHPIAKEFFDFYRTPRGKFTPEGAQPELTTKPTLSSNSKFMNFYPFNDMDSISPRPLLFISGDQAHSIEFSQSAYEKAVEPKELYLVEGAGHVDLYDRVELIPFDKLDRFFREHLTGA
ncbi:alpha/beta hydrolase [Neptuniibacter halophilus]|uniref:alpha/beta hydrolase n=1 Tax=Neptuniibacter halophilus TaxID=651666 RepID=UPI0025738CFF|nr:alpha/beta hydrolase [Neptuniibacter halophilus]